MTGGWDGTYLSSTEIYVLSSSAWSSVASLPSGRSNFQAATVNNAVYVFGEINSERNFYYKTVLGGTYYSSSSGRQYYDDIYRYDQIRNSWTDAEGLMAAKMKVKRRDPSVSLMVVSNYCN